MANASLSRPATRDALRSTLAVTALLAAVALAPAKAAGQDLGVRLGSYLGDDADDPVPVVGVFSRFDLPGPLNLELSADYRNERLRGGDIEAMVVPLRASAVLNLMAVVSPYLLGGVGMDYVNLDFRNEFGSLGDDSDIVFEIHAGAGIEVGLGPLSLGADLRYCRATEVSTDALRSTLGHGYDPSGWAATLVAGFSF